MSPSGTSSLKQENTGLASGSIANPEAKQLQDKDLANIINHNMDNKPQIKQTGSEKKLKFKNSINQAIIQSKIVSDLSKIKQERLEEE